MHQNIHHENDSEEEKSKEHHCHCVSVNISLAIITSEFKYQFVKPFQRKEKILFANYAYTHVDLNNLQKALTPKHSIGSVLMYEIHNKWRVGYEAYYKSSQLRNDLNTTPNYWTMGFMVMRTFRKVSLYTNFENFTDTKQQNYQ